MPIPLPGQVRQVRKNTTFLTNVPNLPTGKVRQVRKNTRFLTNVPNLPTGKVRQVRKNTRFLTNVPNLPNLPTVKGGNLRATTIGGKYDHILPLGRGAPRTVACLPSVDAIITR